jgi:signal transduction histidine kinase
VAFASAAHEFRNPLNGIVTSLELLKDLINHQKGWVYYTTALNCTKLMLFLVKDILDFSQIESRSFILNTNEECVVEDMLAECIDLFRFKANEKGVALSYVMAGGSGSNRDAFIKRKIRTD